VNKGENDLVGGLEAIQALLRELAAGHGSGYVLRMICDTLCSLFAFQSSAVAVRDSDEVLRIKASSKDLQSYLDNTGLHELAQEEAEIILRNGERRGDLYLYNCVPQTSTQKETWCAFLQELFGVGRYDLESVLVLPLIHYSDGLLGLLLIKDSKVRVPQSDVRFPLISTIAYIALLALQLEESRSYAEAQRRILEAQRQRLKELFVASTDLQRASRLEEILTTTAESVTSVCGFRRSAIYLIDGDRLKLEVTNGFSDHELSEFVKRNPISIEELLPLFDRKMSLAKHYLYDHRQRVVYHLAGDQHKGGMSWVRSAGWNPLFTLLIPIIDHEEVLGLLAVEEPDGVKFPDREQLRVVEFFADQAAAAIAQMRVHQLLKVEAGTDPLTGLYNRRSFMALALSAISTERSSTRKVALFYVDLDRFKSVNDQFGHQTGDRVLVECANRIKRAVRQNDLVARFGGEEFLLLCPDLERRTVGPYAERIRVSLEFSIPSGYRVSASVGGAFAELSPMFGEPEVILDDLIARADRALYRAKRNGRNRYELC
jgi:diguanylate cyclase (GGDEF)-like protein